jgi:hypothetical protein
MTVKNVGNSIYMMFLFMCCCCVRIIFGVCLEGTVNNVTCNMSIFINILLNTICQCFPKCGMNTTDGIQKDFMGYLTGHKSLKIVPECYLLPDIL